LKKGLNLFFEFLKFDLLLLNKILNQYVLALLITVDLLIIKCVFMKPCVLKSISLIFLISIFAIYACNESTKGTNADMKIPEGMYLVETIESEISETPPKKNQEAVLQIERGVFFTFARPEGWQIGENGQYSLSLSAPDGKAIIFMVGNSGLLPDQTPYQYAYQTMMALQPQNLSMSQGIAIQPIQGFSYAMGFDVHYYIQGAPCRGYLTCHVQPYYGGAVMAVTGACSDASQWEGYKNWLPIVSEQIAAIDGNAFGMRGLMAQNIENSKSYALAAQNYRAWSSKLQEQITNDRYQSKDRQNEQFRENIGGVNTWSNPFEQEKNIEIQNKYNYYWMDAQGNVLGTDDPGINPNQGSTSEWKAMKRKQ
jgi:hypothetical protein